MSHSHWKTGSPVTRSGRIISPSAGQVLRQLGIVALIVAVWGGLFAAYLSAVGLQSSASIAARPGAVPGGPTQTPLAIAQPTPGSISAPATAHVAPSPTSPATAPADPTRPAPTQTTVPATNTPMPSTPTTAPVATSQSSAAVSFSQDVLPILNRVCVKCHGGEQTEEGLALSTYADVIKGSFNGPVIAPGNSKASLLIDLITQGKMPKRGPKLLPAEIRLITQWVDAGAPNN